MALSSGVSWLEMVKGRYPDARTIWVKTMARRRWSLVKEKRLGVCWMCWIMETEAVVVVEVVVEEEEGEEGEEEEEEEEDDEEEEVGEVPKAEVR